MHLLGMVCIFCTGYVIYKFCIKLLKIWLSCIKLKRKTVKNDEIKSCDRQVVYKGDIIVMIMEGRPPLKIKFYKEKEKFYETN